MTSDHDITVAVRDNFSVDLSAPADVHRERLLQASSRRWATIQISAEVAP